MTDALFTDSGGGVLVPSPHTRGPWDPGAQHGGAVAGLLVRAVEALDAPAPMLLGRLTVEFLGPVPLEPLSVSAAVVRPGRRMQLAEAEIAAAGRTVCRARAMRLRRAPVEAPVPAAESPPPPPDRLEPARFGSPIHDEPEGFAATAMELRFAEGGWAAPGPACAWFRLRMPLVAGEPVSAAQRAAAAADFGNGISAELPFASHLFVNTDLTLHLARVPFGEWIALRARTEHGPEGTALARSEVHDLRGPLGLAAQSLYVEARPSA